MDLLICEIIAIMVTGLDQNLSFCVYVLQHQLLNFVYLSVAFCH